MSKLNDKYKCPCNGNYSSNSMHTLGPTCKNKAFYQPGVCL